MSTDTEREIERERTTDKGRDESRAGAGRERATVLKSKTGVAVVEPTVACFWRLTGPAGSCCPRPSSSPPRTFVLEESPPGCGSSLLQEEMQVGL